MTLEHLLRAELLVEFHEGDSISLPSLLHHYSNEDWSEQVFLLSILRRVV